MLVNLRKCRGSSNVKVMVGGYVDKSSRGRSNSTIFKSASSDDIVQYCH